MSEARIVILALAALLAAGATRAEDGDLGDPTRPTALSPNSDEDIRGPRWRLQSTLIADTRRLAVINGQTVPEGGRIQGATLVEVRQDGVTLEHDGQRIRLRLLREALEVKSGGG